MVLDFPAGTLIARSIRVWKRRKCILTEFEHFNVVAATCRQRTTRKISVHTYANPDVLCVCWLNCCQLQCEKGCTPSVHLDVLKHVAQTSSTKRVSVSSALLLAHSVPSFSMKASQPKTTKNGSSFFHVCACAPLWALTTLRTRQVWRPRNVHGDGKTWRYLVRLSNA